MPSMPLSLPPESSFWDNLMRITVLDGHGLNPGDISWDSVKALADECIVYDRTPQELVAQRIAGSEIVLLNKIRITRDIIERCPNLRYIGLLSTGYNVVDLGACRDHGVIVTNIPSYSTDAVAQHVFSFILHFTNQISAHSDSVRSGGWISSADFCYWLSPLSELAGKTLGIFGFGNIGRKVAEIAVAFGMRVIVRARSSESFERARNLLQIHESKRSGITPVSVDELFSRSDFVTLHAPLTDETERLVGERALSLMKRSAYLINTARGGMVDENAVRSALVSNRIAGYAADVLESEPMSGDCPLYKAPNCVITPHLAWAPRETRLRLLDIEVRNIKAFLSGEPINAVS